MYNKWMILKLTRNNHIEAINSAISVLKGGGIVAYPTETFYGLGAGYDNGAAVDKLYRLKQRPKGKAMPLIIGSMDQLDLLTDAVSESARELMQRYWPGPLTLIFAARPGLPAYIVSESRVAVRIPGESFALELAVASGFPITATSANISGMPPAGDAPAVLNYFDGRLDLIIDGGGTDASAPSTIVDVTGTQPVLLRKGAVDILLP